MFLNLWTGKPEYKSIISIKNAKSNYKIILVANLRFSGFSGISLFSHYLRQSIHEPCKLTFGVSWFAEWSPSQLLANQNRLWASCYVWQAAQLSLTPALWYPITNIWLLHPPKAFFEKSQHVHKVLNDT